MKFLVRRILEPLLLSKAILAEASRILIPQMSMSMFCVTLNKTPIPPEKPPSIGKAVLMLGSIGGHLGRKGDGFPGTQTLWRGLVKLYAATEMYAILTQQHYPHPMQSGP